MSVNVLRAAVVDTNHAKVAPLPDVSDPPRKVFPWIVTLVKLAPPHRDIGRVLDETKVLFE
jgi:hypothetical protein